LGSLAGFPTFNFSGFQNHIGETVLIKQGVGQPHNFMSNQILGNDEDVANQDFRARFRAVHRLAVSDFGGTMVGGFPTFEPPNMSFGGSEESGAILFPVLTAGPRVVALSELTALNGGASLNDPRQEFRAAHAFARNQQGIVAGFPTFIRGNSVNSDGTLAVEDPPVGGLTTVILLTEFAAEIQQLSVFTPIP
jgi:hypothetical protein